MAEQINSKDIFMALARSYDQCKDMYNKPYTVEFKAGKKSWTKTAYLPALSFANVKVSCILTLSKTGNVLGFRPADEYKLIPKELCGSITKLPSGVLFTKLRYLIKDWRPTNDFIDAYDEFVATGVEVPEVVKIIFDYYKRDTVYDDICTYYAGQVRNVTREKEEANAHKKAAKKAAKESGEEYVESTEDTVEEANGKSTEILTDSSIMYVEVAGYENIETDEKYITFCQSFVDFVNQRKNATVRDICMIEGIETDCILVGNSKSKDPDMKLGFLPTFPYETSAKIVSKADSRNFTNNIRYSFRCKSAMQSMSIGYKLYQKVLAMFSFMLKLYKKNGVLCWVVNAPKRSVDLGDLFPEFSDEFIDNSSVVSVDEVSDTVLSPVKFKAFQNYVNMRVAKYPFRDEDELLILSPVVGTGRVTFKNFENMTGSAFRSNIGYWYRHMNTLSSNTVFFPTIRNMLDAVCYTKGMSKRTELVQKWRDSLLNSMYHRKPIASDIMISVMSNMRKSELGTLKPETDYKGTEVKYVKTVAAMLRYNLSFKEEDKYMVLDKTITDRDYLFGRLLALYQYVEQKAWESRDAKDVATNAQKFSTRYMQMPISTEALIYDRLVKGHIHKLDKPMRIWFENTRNEIYALFNEADFTNKPLGDKWLMGYTLQNGYFYRKRTAEGEVVDKEELKDWSDDSKSNPDAGTEYLTAESDETEDTDETDEIEDTVD